MNCAEAGRLLHPYADSELELQAALAIEQHLQDCARCRASFAGVAALRAALARACEPERAPPQLRARILRDLAARAAPAVERRRNWLLAAPGVAALVLVAALLVAQPWRAQPPGSDRAHVVFHIATADNLTANLRTLKNHLDASPGVHAVVVAHNAGVEFLLRGARDETGRPYAEIVRDFRERGVEFRVCTNTLTRRQIDTAAVIPEAVLVPSGIAEISRLQAREGYVYLRL
ncbi:MAG: DsrE family protein [Pseudomonadota bacterium]